MFTIAATERVLTVLVESLTPYVGATMARASVRGFCARLGLEQPQIDRKNVTRLVDVLVPALDVYVGKDKARTIVAQIWSALDADEARAKS